MAPPGDDKKALFDKKNRDKARKSLTPSTHPTAPTVASPAIKANKANSPTMVAPGVPKFDTKSNDVQATDIADVPDDDPSIEDGDEDDAADPVGTM
jgi:hypothetical protein